MRAIDTNYDERIVHFRGLLGTAAAAAAVVAISPAQTQTVAPKTLVSIDSLITAFAQDGSRIAWLSPQARCRQRLVVRTLTTGHQIGLPTAHSALCDVGSFPLDVLSLAGRRTVYAVLGSQGLSEDDGAILTNTSSDRRERGVCGWAVSRGEGISEPTFVAQGDGPTSIAVLDGGEPVEGGRGCSRLWRVDADGRATRLRNVPSSPQIAVAGNRFAVARTRSVKIRDRSGRLIRTIPETSSISAVALSATLIALLVTSTTGDTQLQVFATKTGQVRWSIQLPAPASTSLSIAGGVIAYSRGREIWVANVTSQRLTHLATAAATPIGLSIEGRRVAWAENRNLRGRIRAIEIPR